MEANGSSTSKQLDKNLGNNGGNSSPAKLQASKTTSLPQLKR